MKYKLIIALLLLPFLLGAWRAGSLPNFFFYDGASSPVDDAPQGAYASDTNATWLCWEGWQSVSGTLKRVVECATINHSTGAWVGNYIAGTQTLSGDLHGTPTIARDPVHKHVYVFYGAHNSSTQYSYTTNADDPSTWTTGSLLSSTYGAMTFPWAAVNGSTLYLFYCTGPGASPNSQSQLAVTTATIASDGSLTWSGTFKVLVDFGTGAWLLANWTEVNNGTIGVYVTFSYGATYPNYPLQNEYVAQYLFATGNLANASGSTSVAPASQPVNLTTANANFEVLSSTNADVGQLAIDGGGVLHLVYGDQTTSPETIKYINNSAGTWSSPFTVFTYPSAVTSQIYGWPVPNAVGGIDVYYTDGLGAGSGQYAASNGNAFKRTRSSGGSWGSAQLIYGAQNYSLIEPLGVSLLANGGSPYIRVVFSESSSDGVAIAGNLRGYAYGDYGFVKRPWPWSVLNPK